MALSIVVVCEAPPDQQTACALADRVVCEQVEWIEVEHLPNLRAWRGERPNEFCFLWTRIPRLAEKKGLKLFGHFQGEPGEIDAHVARKALTLCKLLRPPLHAVMLIRDADDQPERRHGLEQARSLNIVKAPVVIGLAEPKRECWILAGFDPDDDTENAKLETEREHLGFDPRHHSAKLAAKPDDAKKSAKRVLNALCDRDRERENRCVKATSLDILRDRGRENGLTMFLDEVRTLLVPLFTQASEGS